MANEISQHIIDKAHKEVTETSFPDDFAGGCMVLNTCPGYCAHIKPDGTIAEKGGIDPDCNDYPCRNRKHFKYNVMPTIQ